MPTAADLQHDRAQAPQRDADIQGVGWERSQSLSRTSDRGDTAEVNGGKKGADKSSETEKVTMLHPALSTSYKSWSNVHLDNISSLLRAPWSQLCRSRGGRIFRGLSICIMAIHNIQVCTSLSKVFCKLVQHKQTKTHTQREEHIPSHTHTHSTRHCRDHLTRPQWRWFQGTVSRSLHRWAGALHPLPNAPFCSCVRLARYHQC